MTDTITHNAEDFNAVKVESKDLNVLILRRLKEPRKNFAGQSCRWELEYRWLSQYEPELCCVRGSEINLFPLKEINPNESLFDQFDLF